MRHPSLHVLGRIALGAAVLLIVASCASGSTPAPAAQSPSARASAVPSTVDAASPSGPLPSAISTKTVKLVAVGSSGVSGTATLSDIGGGQTVVVIKVEANYNQDMPSMIGMGPCSGIDESNALFLNDTRNGTGTTVVTAALADLVKSPHQVHLHTSGEDLSYTACGDIK